MTEQDKYNALLTEIGALLLQKNERIMFQEFELATLRSNIEKLENELKKINEVLKNE